MIDIHLCVQNGLLESCFIQGHAEAGPFGADIVCAAVSVLARAAELSLARKDGIVALAKAPYRGEFSLEVSAVEEAKPFLAGVTAFFEEGLVSVAEEYPRNCRLFITR